MKRAVEFLPGLYYHVVLKANSDAMLFKDATDRICFMNRINAFILPCCEVIAFVILGNHAHFLIRPHSVQVLAKLSLNLHLLNLQIYAGDLDSYLQNPDPLFLPPSAPLHTGTFHDQIQSCLRSLKYSYDRYHLRKYGFSGCLWSRYKSITILANTEDIARTILYIHKNPVFHGMVHQVGEWPFSSYNDIVMNIESRVRIKNVFAFFQSEADFFAAHECTADEFGRKPSKLLTHT
jgi:putative transposase